MTDIAIGVLLLITLVLSLTTWTAGAIIARRASRGRRWPEARLALLGFAAMPVITVAPAFVFPLNSWLNPGVPSSVLVYYSFILSNLAYAAALVSIAVAMYRLAAGVRHRRAD